MRTSCVVEQLDGDVLTPTHALSLSDTHTRTRTLCLSSSLYTQVKRKVTHISLAEGCHTRVYVSTLTPHSSL